MAAAETAKLVAALTLKDGFTGPIAKVNKSLGRFDANLSRTQGRAYRAGQQIGTGIKAGAIIAAAGVGLLATQVIAGLDSLSKLEDATAQTNAVLKSTKGVAGQTAGSVRALAEQMENLNATIDDKVVQSAENVLLTFTNVRKEAFAPALLAALDLNKALGGGEESLQGVVLKVGKALNDPVKGITALRKSGVAFTAQQVKQIKALQKSGDLLGAQKIVLAELSKEFGGSFAAGGKTATGTIAGIGDAVEDLQKALATGLFPIIQKVLPRLRDFLTSPAFVRGAKDLGDKIAALFSDQNINSGIAALKGLFETGARLMPALSAGAGAVATAVKAAVSAFTSLPPEIQSLAVAGLAINKLTGGLVTNVAGGLISAVISSFKGMMNVNAAAVTVNGPVVGGLGGGGGLPGAVGGAAGGAATLGVGATLIGVAGAAVIGGLIARAVVGAVAGEQVHEIETGRVTPLGNRDPRRFNAAGQVVRNVIAKPEKPRITDLERPMTDSFKTLSGKIADDTAAVDKLKGKLSDDIGTTTTSVDRAKSAVDDAKSQIVGNLRGVASAVRASVPITNVDVNVSATTVQQSTTVVTRYGPTGGDRNTGKTASSGGFGNQ